MNDIFLPIIYTSTASLSRGFWLGFILTLLCFVACATIAYIDYSDSQHNTPESGVLPAPSVCGLFGSFSRVYYVVCLLCGFVYMSFMSFNATASSLVQYRFGFSVRTAGFIIVHVHNLNVVHTLGHHHHWESLLGHYA